MGSAMSPKSADRPRQPLARLSTFYDEATDTHHVQWRNRDYSGWPRGFGFVCFWLFGWTGIGIAFMQQNDLDGAPRLALFGMGLIWLAGIGVSIRLIVQRFATECIEVGPEHYRHYFLELPGPRWRFKLARVREVVMGCFGEDGRPMTVPDSAWNTEQILVRGRGMLDEIARWVPRDDDKAQIYARVLVAFQHHGVATGDAAELPGKP